MAACMLGLGARLRVASVVMRGVPAVWVLSEPCLPRRCDRLAAVAGKRMPAPTPSPQEGHDAVEENLYEQHPNSHGYDQDPHVDLWNMRLVFFFGFSVLLVLGSTFLAYLPDYRMHEWARREAERFLKHREASGLPVMESDYLDPSKMKLQEDGN
ncbi:NADH dehydrogenase [ubiquinone] 1 beta subcomplex subunit 11, mitochondrial-like [Sorex fumeus]|uniref:NADH dehydrogenase [ubiquinone] 1 beta subcomplex subunit 11, mitochondrial-like n=1 Tax=Sorex fumeus TaxID=62283 RepID=UPI0024ACD4DB|nr:NADH dehydrogenase [ubiquinone] 1 beta subcomplex subunit 11, mitochondrial-like [Sorex fumeus]